LLYRKITVAGILILSLLLLFMVFKSPNIKGAGSSGANNEIGVIYVTGSISGGGSDLFSTVAGSETIMSQLRQAADSDVKAVIIRINSPGGSAAASQEIANEINKLRSAGKLVVTSMGDVAASGGYWIAASTDYIFANPGTMTGSIGVIMESTNMQELFDKVGIDFEVIKSGPYKDMGSVSRELTQKEKEIMQSMVDDIYEQFVTTVAKGRSISRERTKSLADGRIFTGKQAKEIGLVDELGNYYDSIDFAAKKVGIKGDPTIRSFGRQTPLEMFLAGTKSVLGQGLQLLNGKVYQFLSLLTRGQGDFDGLQ